LEIKKYAAIDIGSNAIRLLIANAIINNSQELQYKKYTLLRVPIRLGEDAFTTGYISEENKERMIDAMTAFKLIMKINKVERYKACATSAMREATNGQQIANEVFDKTSIKIDIINGKTEAAIIASTDLDSFINNSNSYLYVDVGGGSTELTIFDKGKIINSKSFKLGTVRLLDKRVLKSVWKEMEKWIKANCKDLTNFSLIGSGGNIIKIFKMSGRSANSFLSYIYLRAHYKFLKNLTYEERISELGLNPDRADVIIPALKIYLNTMKWSGGKKIFVPKIGLADGIIKSLHKGTL